MAEEDEDENRTNNQTTTSANAGLNSSGDFDDPADEPARIIPETTEDDYSSD